MVASNLGADASSRQYADAEGRLSLQEVPDKISRIFFGDPEKQYQQGKDNLVPQNSKITCNTIFYYNVDPIYCIFLP